MAKGRPNRQPFIGFRVPQTTYEKIRNLASQQGRSLSSLVRRALTFYLAAPDRAEEMLWTIQEEAGEYQKGKKNTRKKRRRKRD